MKGSYKLVASAILNLYAPTNSALKTDRTIKGNRQIHVHNVES